MNRKIICMILLVAMVSSMSQKSFAVSQVGIKMSDNMMRTKPPSLMDYTELCTFRYTQATQDYDSDAYNFVHLDSSGYSSSGTFGMVTSDPDDLAITSVNLTLFDLQNKEKTDDFNKAIAVLSALLYDTIADGSMEMLGLSPYEEAHKYLDSMMSFVLDDKERVDALFSGEFIQCGEDDLYIYKLAYVHDEYEGTTIETICLYVTLK